MFGHAVQRRKVSFVIELYYRGVSHCPPLLPADEWCMCVACGIRHYRIFALNHHYYCYSKRQQQTIRDARNVRCPMLRVFVCAWRWHCYANAHCTFIVSFRVRTHTQSRRQHCANALMPSDVGQSFLAWFKSIFNCIRSVTSIACDIRALLVHSCVRNGFAWQIRRFIRDKPGRRINRISLYSIELFLHVDITQCFIEHKMANVRDFHSVKMIQMNRRSAWPHRRPLLFV